MPKTSLSLWVPLVNQRDFSVTSHTAVSARGVHVTFEDGQRRICAKSGLWNVNLGYGNEIIASAIAAEQRSASTFPCSEPRIGRP